MLTRHFMPQRHCSSAQPCPAAGRRFSYAPGAARFSIIPSFSATAASVQPCSATGRLGSPLHPFVHVRGTSCGPILAPSTHCSGLRRFHNLSPAPLAAPLPSASTPDICAQPCQQPQARALWPGMDARIRNIHHMHHSISSHRRASSSSTSLAVLAGEGFALLLLCGVRPVGAQPPGIARPCAALQPRHTTLITECRSEYRRSEAEADERCFVFGASACKVYGTWCMFIDM